MTITSPVDDKLVGAKADPSVAAEVQIHEVVMLMPDDMGLTHDGHGHGHRHHHGHGHGHRHHHGTWTWAPTT